MLPPCLIHIFYHLVAIAVQNPDNIALKILHIPVRSSIPLQPQQAARIIIEEIKTVFSSNLDTKMEASTKKYWLPSRIR